MNLLLQDDLIPDRAKRPVVESLKVAIEAAEDGAAATLVSFVTTRTTARQLMKCAVTRKSRSTTAQRLHLVLKKYRRNTKQRVYFQLPIEISLLRELRDLLDNSDPGKSIRAFERIADQIEAEVLSKSPLKLLADTGV